MRLLSIDIETAPHTVYTWGLFDQTVGLDQIIKPGEVLCFAAKFMDEKKVRFHSQWGDGRAEMVAAAHALLDEAEVVMHFNGRRFDIPWLNYEFMLQGFRPPAPYRQIDLLEVARRQFRFASNKLQYVSTALGLAGKAQTGGFKLWLGVMAGDEVAQARMKRYNVQDTRLLEDLYAKLQPWIPNHPNRALYDGTSGCPTCAAEGQMQRRGFAVTSARRYQKWQCQACGSYFRSASVKGSGGHGADLRAVA